MRKAKRAYGLLFCAIGVGRESGEEGIAAGEGESAGVLHARGDVPRHVGGGDREAALPERGLPEGALLEDLPLFPNPFDHSGDVDTETDPAKVRTKPYDFNGADVRLETREVIIPKTWEDDKLGPPAQNRFVRLTVHVRQLGLPVVAAAEAGADGWSAVQLQQRRADADDGPPSHAQAERTLPDGPAGVAGGGGEEGDEGGGDGAAPSAGEARPVLAVQQGHAGLKHGEEAVRGNDHGGRVGCLVWASVCYKQAIAWIA